MKRIEKNQKDLHDNKISIKSSYNKLISCGGEEMTNQISNESRMLSILSKTILISKNLKLKQFYPLNTKTNNIQMKI
jgi:hypothetical protein